MPYLKIDNNTPEEILIDELGKGNEDAFTEIYQRHHKKVGLAVYHKTRSKQEIKDITQDVFNDLWRDRNSKKVKKSVLNYLIKMAKHKSIDWLRSKAKRESHLNKHLYAQATSEVPTNRLDLQYYNKCINMILETECSESDRNAFKYYHEERMTYQQVADKLGTSISNARSYVSKAMRVIKKNIGKYS